MEGTTEHEDADDDKHVWEDDFALAQKKFKAFDILSSTDKAHKRPSQHDVCDGSPEDIEQALDYAFPAPVLVG